MSEPPRPPTRHYFDASPAVGSRSGSVNLVLPDLAVELRTDRGVFAADRIDAGTKLLLLVAPHPTPAATVLDLGCGYGPVACAQALRRPDAVVWAVDVNERARNLCRTNAEALGATNVRVCAPDEVPPESSFDLVYSNPPIRIGKQALHDLLDHWLGRLTPATGVAHLVVQRHLGADSLARWLTGLGHPVERLASRQGYRILSVGART